MWAELSPGKALYSPITHIEEERKRSDPRQKYKKALLAPGQTK